MRRLFPVLIALSLLLAPAARAEDDLFCWTLTLTGNGAIIPAAIAPVEDGAFVAGETMETGGVFGPSYGGRDAFLLRVDGEGNVLWKHRYGGSGDDLFTHVVPTADGGCVAMGTTTSTDQDARASRGGMDAFLVRVSAEGDLLWTKCLGGTLDDQLLDIVLTEDGQYFVCGRTKSRNGDLGSNQGGWDAWAALLSDTDGKPVWVMRYGQSGDDEFSKALPAPDGWMLLGVLAEQEETAYGEMTYQSRPIVLMLSSAQEELWQVTLGGVGINQLRMAIPTDTGWLFAGETNSSSALMPSVRGGLDIWALSLRQNKTVVWQKTYGGSADDRAALVRSMPDGGYALLGATRSDDGQVTGAHGDWDVWLLKLSATGSLEWQQTVGGSGYSMPAGLLTTADGGFLIAGTSLSQDGDIGRHDTERTGFLSLLASNGNLIWTRQVGDGAECALVALAAKDGAGYAVGGVLGADETTEGLFLGRLAIEGLTE